MNSKDRGGSIHPQFEIEEDGSHGEAMVDDATTGESNDELSSVGMLCQDILVTIDQVTGFPDASKSVIGNRIGNILAMFTEQEDRQRQAKRKISGLKADLRRVTEKFVMLRQEHFGVSSEQAKDDPDDDDDFILDDEAEEAEEKPKGKRARKIPKDATPVVIHHYPDNRSCCTCGCEMPSISNWKSMRLKIVPEHVEYIQDVYHTCACNRGLCKENKPVAAKAQNRIMHGRGLDLGFVVEAAAQKYFEHIPTFRLERRLYNGNVNLTRQALGRNLGYLANCIDPVRQQMFAQMKDAHMVHMDETPVRVLAPGKGKCDTGQFWVICHDERSWNPEAKPAVFYHYAPSREGRVAEELLSGASIKYLLTDGLAAYNRLFDGERSNDAMAPVRCWAHARRKFYEVSLMSKSKMADRVVKMIRAMYAVEKAAKGLSHEERAAMRQERSLPVLNALHAELLKHQGQVEGKLKTAINYTLKAFDGLRRFIFDGRLEIDNNPVERCIRGIALTKKNSLFAGNHEAAQTWAIYYTLIETARLNQVNPRSYLNWVTSEIERQWGNVDYSQLMPWHCPIGHIES